MQGDVLSRKTREYCPPAFLECPPAFAPEWSKKRIGFFTSPEFPQDILRTNLVNKAFPNPIWFPLVLPTEGLPLTEKDPPCQPFQAFGGNFGIREKANERTVPVLGPKDRPRVGSVLGASRKLHNRPNKISIEIKGKKRNISNKL